MMLGCFLFAFVVGSFIITIGLNGYLNYTWIILPFSAFFFGIALYVFMAWKLWRSVDDFVGGLESFGLFMLISFFIPFTGAIIPCFLYKIFANAEEYVDEYGYSED